MIVFAQEQSNLRKKTFLLLSDTTYIDTLIIVPHSELVYNEYAEIIPDSLYRINYNKSIFISQKNLKNHAQSIKIVYRVLNTLP